MNINSFLAKNAYVIKTHPAGLLAVYKPEGILSHPNNNLDIHKSLLHLPYNLKEEAYYNQNGEKIYVLHRLDSPTSGVILLATNQELAKVVKKAFSNRVVDKTYYALVKGVPKGRFGVWVDKINTYNKEGKLRTKVGFKGEVAKTRWRLILTRGGVSYLELSPLTGFTHQLRVQCALHHSPIVGDKTYGDFLFNKVAQNTLDLKRLCLHAQKVSLEFQYQNINHKFHATALSKMFENFTSGAEIKEYKTKKYIQ